MEKRYSDAMKTGFKCGIVIVILYMILSLINLGLGMTPAMKSYNDQMNQYNKDIYNRTYSPGSYPHYYSQPYTSPMPSPPAEFYISLVIGAIIYGLLILGLVATGAFAIRKGSELKYTLKDTAIMGIYAGAAAFVPIFVWALIQGVIGFYINASAYSSLSSMFPGLSTILPVLIVVEYTCCCLPFSIIASLVLSCMGACGYAVITRRLENRTYTT